MASSGETLIRCAVAKGIGKVADFNRRRLPRPTDAHPYLTGIHKPMEEELTLEALAVDGEIPAALSGRYLRNGPNPALPRSEEHTSELQSLMRNSYAVFCLKKQNTPHTNTDDISNYNHH